MTSMATDTEAPGTNPSGVDQDPGRAVFVFDVDGVTFEHNRPKITGGEIMDMAGIPYSQGLVQVHEDGTTTTVGVEDEVHLVPGAQFKRRPRFKRG